MVELRNMHQFGGKYPNPHRHLLVLSWSLLIAWLFLLRDRHLGLMHLLLHHPVGDKCHLLIHKRHLTPSRRHPRPHMRNLRSWHLMSRRGLEEAHSTYHYCLYTWTSLLDISETERYTMKIKRKMYLHLNLKRHVWRFFIFVSGSRCIKIYKPWPKYYEAICA